jgi:hypothetical protein
MFDAFGHFNRATRRRSNISLLDQYNIVHRTSFCLHFIVRWQVCRSFAVEDLTENLKELNGMHAPIWELLIINSKKKIKMLHIKKVCRRWKTATRAQARKPLVARQRNPNKYITSSTVCIVITNS